MFTLAGCPTEDDGGGGGGGGSGSITYTATADGSATTTSTKIDFVFSADVDGLQASHITITAGTGDAKGNATVGTLTGSAKNWSLSISGVTAGAATVKITKADITDAAGTITLYRRGVPAEKLGVAASKADAQARLDAIIAYEGTKQPIKDWAAAYKTRISSYAFSDTNRTEINEMLDWIDINGPLWTTLDSTSGSPFYASTTINDIAYGGGKFVAVGQNNQMATSPDGITWTAVTSPFSTGTTINAVAYGGSKWVAAAAGGRMAYATDPNSTWTLIPAGTGANQSQFTSDKAIYAVAYGGGKWVAVGEDNGKMAWATDPSGTWTAVTNAPSFENYDFFKIAYGGDKWVVTDQYQISWATDPSGTWTEPVNIDGFPSIYGIVYDGPSGQEKFFMAGSTTNGVSAIAYSTNGSTDWTEANSGHFSTSGYFEGIAYGGGNFVTAGGGGSVGASPDGITWSVRSEFVISNPTNPSGSTDIKGIAYGGGRFVVVGKESKIAYSDERE
jgi:hypothetical protein